jgi:hypothetical protein
VAVEGRAELGAGAGAGDVGAAGGGSDDGTDGAGGSARATEARYPDATATRQTNQKGVARTPGPG